MIIKNMEAYDTNDFTFQFLLATFEDKNTFKLISTDI